MRKIPILSAQMIVTSFFKRWSPVALCAFLSWGVLGVAKNGHTQTEPSTEELLKELKKQEAKSSDVRLRPAAGKPVVEEVIEEVVEEIPVVEETVKVPSTGLIDTEAFAKLSPAQQKLVTSYDNFIGLFPEDEKIPELLYNTGSTYFQKEQYPVARGVYTRILDQYPNSGRWYVESLSNIVESYRRENDFKNLEMWSERLRTDPNAPDSLKEAGKKLAAGAIANAASELARQSAESGDTQALVLAAEEYIRTARTYPDAEFASISLYNAGYTYKKAEIYDKAADVWLDMVQRYPDVAYADTAMWEAALAYDQNQNYQSAIQVYEQFVSTFPTSEFRMDALKNRIFDYNEIEDWDNAAASYEAYATEFPEDAGLDRSYKVALSWLKAKNLENAAAAFDRFEKEDASNPKVKEVQFEMGQAYIKQGNLAKANEHFARFARVNPDNPLSVKIHYDLGEFYLNNQQVAEAQVSYNEAVKVSEALQNRGLDGNNFYRGEAYMRLASMTHPDYNEIKLVLPKPTFDANFERKKNLGKDLEKFYQGVILSGSIKGAEAAYQLSEAYENMANTWLTQELGSTPSTDVLKRQEEIKALNAEGIAFLNQAITPLEAVHLKRAGEYADIKYDTTWDASHTTVLSTTKVDSTENQWVTKAKTRIVELQLRVADLVAAPYNYFLDHFYEVPIPRAPKKIRDQLGPDLTPIIVNNQFYASGLQTTEGLINSEVLPSYQKAIDYQKPPPDGYSLTGPAVQKAQRDALAMAIRPLRLDAARVPDLLGELEKGLKQWVQMTDSLMYRPENIKDPFAFSELLYKSLDGQTLPTYNDISLEISRQMSLKYDNVIELAGNMGVDQALIDSLKVQMVRFHYDRGSQYLNLAKYSENISNRYFDRVAQIDSIIAAGGPLAQIFTDSEASVVLNDVTTSPGGFDDLNFNLRNGALEILETGYSYEERYPVAGDLFKEIRSKLSDLDPQLYPPPSEDYRFTYGSDTSWELGTMPTENWSMSGFQGDTNWSNAQMSLALSVGSLIGFEQSTAMAIWGAGPDTTGAGADSLIYTRKEFMVFGTPDSVGVRVVATGPFEVFVNGVSAGKVENSDSNSPQMIDITSYILGTSLNTVGIQVSGVSSQQGGLVMEIQGVDRVPQSVENINTVRQFYNLPANMRQMPDTSAPQTPQGQMPN